jgi:hypothetical protein
VQRGNAMPQSPGTTAESMTATARNLLV